MSDFLETNKNERRLFVGKVARYGKKTLSGKLCNVIVLSNVRDIDTYEPIAIQLTFKCLPFWKGFIAGDDVQFEAAIGKYQHNTKRACQKSGALIDDEYWLASPSHVSIWLGGEV